MFMPNGNNAGSASSAAADSADAQVLNAPQAVTVTENIIETVKYYVCNDCGFRVSNEEMHNSEGHGNGVAND